MTFKNDAGEEFGGNKVEFKGLFPGVPLNPEVRVGVWVRMNGHDDLGDWFVSELHGDFARIVQGGKIRAERRGTLTVVPT